MLYKVQNVLSFKDKKSYLLRIPNLPIVSANIL